MTNASQCSNPDCGEWHKDWGLLVVCKCNLPYCNANCLGASDFKVVLDEQIKDYDWIYDSCCRCRHEKFSERDLLTYALQKLGVKESDLYTELKDSWEAYHRI